MREIVFMWMAAMFGFMVGYLSGRGFRRNGEIDAFDRGAEWAEQRIAVPGAGSEPELYPLASDGPSPATLAMMNAMERNQADMDAVLGPNILDPDGLRDAVAMAKGRTETFVGQSLSESIAVDWPGTSMGKPATRLPPDEEAKIVSELWPDTNCSDPPKGFVHPNHRSEQAQEFFDGITELNEGRLTTKPER